MRKLRRLLYRRPVGGPVSRRYHFHSNISLQTLINAMIYRTNLPLPYGTSKQVASVNSPAYFHNLPRNLEGYMRILTSLTFYTSCRASVTAPTLFASVPCLLCTIRTDWLAAGKHTLCIYVASGAINKSPTCATCPPRIIMLGLII